MPEDYCRGANALAQQVDNVLRILWTVVSASDTGGLAMTPQVGRENVPALAEGWNKRQKYLPAAAESVQQQERRPIRRAFPII